MGKTIEKLEKTENIDESLIRYLTVRVKKHNLEENYFKKIKQEFLISCSSDDEREIINQSFLASEEEGKLRFDLRKLARQQLQLLGVNEIYGEESCTYCDESNFYSYRRDGVTGRMASIIYFTEAS